MKVSSNPRLIFKEKFSAFLILFLYSPSVSPLLIRREQRIVFPAKLLIRPPVIMPKNRFDFLFLLLMKSKISQLMAEKNLIG